MSGFRGYARLAIIAGLSYSKNSCYVLNMVDVFTSYFPISMRRCGVPITPYFSHLAGSENIPIQCQLPEISGTFGKGRILEITAFLLRAFAASREPLATSPHAARPDYSRAKPQRREAGWGDELPRLTRLPHRAPTR